jgi:hypothetical protein
MYEQDARTPNHLSYHATCISRAVFHGLFAGRLADEANMAQLTPGATIV